MSRKRKSDVDEMWLACVAEDLRDDGMDEEFIQCCLEELREGAQVTIVTSRGQKVIGGDA